MAIDTDACAGTYGMGALIRFGAGSWPGESAGEDAMWAADAALARHELALQHESGITSPVDASWQALLEWIDDQIGAWDPVEFEPLVREQIDALLRARRRGRERGIVMRMYQAGQPAELCLEVDVPGPVPPGWKEPVSTRVAAVLEGDTAPGEQLGLRLVRDPAAAFNGTLIAVAAGERWRLRGERLDDGTVVPVDGTRRLAA